jgi:suppressor of ftsI
VSLLRGPGNASRPITGEIVIGREADLQVDDPEASRRHAAVRPVADGVEVEDLGSRNGTFVDGERLAGKVRLRSSATLRIGNTELQIEVQAQSERTQVRAAMPPDAGAGRRRVAVIGGGVAALAAVAVVLALVLSGGSAKHTAAAARVNPNCDAHFPNMIHDGFPEPPMKFSHDGVLNTTLTAGTDTIHDAGHTWQGLEYDGTSPGPTWVICRGDVLNVKLINKSPLPTNLHVHGLHVSPSGHSDNVFVSINPLQSFQYSYRIPLDQSPGAFWYHPHFHPLVDAETTAGMLGGILVEGGLDNVMPNIPQRLIIISGGKPCIQPFNTAGGQTQCTPLPIPGSKPGQIKPPPAPGPSEQLVNGVYQPTLHIQPGQLQRWRIWNSTGERMIMLQLPGVTFEVLAYDGNSLRYMRPQSQILLGPGERVEVLVRGQPAGSYTLNSMPFQPCFRSCFDPFGGVPNNGRNFGYQDLINVVSSGTPVNEPLPTDPIGNPIDLRGDHVDVYRTLILSRQPRVQQTPAFPISGKVFSANRVDVTMALNSIEQWTIQSPDNATDDEWHNFHIHTNAFQVIAINGKPLSFVDWQDTVNVPPGGSVTILIHPIDFVGKAVYHCHIDFHEDNGMMGVFQIVKDPPPSAVNAHRVIFMQPPSLKQSSTPALLAQVARLNNASPLARFELLCHLGFV